MIKPTAITADKQRAILTVAWNDGHRTEFPFSELSAVCPCASCNDKRVKLEEQGRDPQKDFVPDSTALHAIELVGSYAINIIWKDGCRYGIYTYDFLLSLEEQHPAWRQ